jgi:hypothetical protein
MKKKYIVLGVPFDEINLDFAGIPSIINFLVFPVTFKIALFAISFLFGQL